MYGQIIRQANILHGLRKDITVSWSKTFDKDAF